MAGKTFSGVGGENDGPEPYEDDSRGVYSGPTVVDDGKVEASLKRLRSLDRPPGPLTGITEAVADPGSGEPTQISELPRSAARPTAVGRSLSTPADAQPVTIPADAARGTMFGRSIHLPDINAPDATLEELSSGSVHVIDSESGPQAIQPFPLAEPPMRPLQRAAAGFAAAPAQVAQPPVVDLSDGTAGDYDFGSDTEPVIARRRWPRVAAAVGGIAVVAVAALVLAPRGGGGGSKSASPSPAAEPARAAATPPAPAPTDDPPGQATTAQAPAPASAPAELPPPVEAPPAPEPAPPPPVRANAEVAEDTPTRRRPAAHRSDPKVGPAAETPAPRSNRARRRRFIREDPDATMAPTLD